MLTLRLRHGNMSITSLRFNNIHCTGRAYLCVFRAPRHESGGYHCLHVGVSCATARIRYTDVLQFELQHSRQGYNPAIGCMCVFRAPPHECCFVNSGKIYDMLELRLQHGYGSKHGNAAIPQLVACACFVRLRTNAAS